MRSLAGEAGGAGELQIAIGKEGEPALRIGLPGPLGHHPRAVGRHADDLVDARGLQRTRIGHQLGDVALGADRGEGAGQSDHHHPPALEVGLERQVLDDLAPQPGQTHLRQPLADTDHGRAPGSSIRAQWWRRTRRGATAPLADTEELTPARGEKLARSSSRQKRNLGSLRRADLRGLHMVRGLRCSPCHEGPRSSRGQKGSIRACRASRRWRRACPCRRT